MDPKGPYVIPDTTREAFIEVLSYLYSGNMNLTVDNVQVCPRELVACVGAWSDSSTLCRTSTKRLQPFG